MFSLTQNGSFRSHQIQWKSLSTVLLFLPYPSNIQRMTWTEVVSLFQFKNIFFINYMKECLLGAEVKVWSRPFHALKFVKIIMGSCFRFKITWRSFFVAILDSNWLAAKILAFQLTSIRGLWIFFFISGSQFFRRDNTPNFQLKLHQLWHVIYVQKSAT